MKTKEDWEKERLGKIAEAEKRLQYLEDNYDGEEVLRFVTTANSNKKGRYIPFIKLVNKGSKFDLIEVSFPNKIEHTIREFSSMNDFWSYFTKDKNWYKNRPKKINPVLCKRITELTNEIRLTQKLSFSELNVLNIWNNRHWDDSIRILLRGRCPNCEILSGIRGYLCSNCAKLVTDSNGKKITLDIWGNYYTETKEKYVSKFGFLNGKKVILHTGSMDSSFYIFSEEQMLSLYKSKLDI